jgi:hypothetical protein
MHAWVQRPQSRPAAAGALDARRPARPTAAVRISCFSSPPQPHKGPQQQQQQQSPPAWWSGVPGLGLPGAQQQQQQQLKPVNQQQSLAPSGGGAAAAAMMPPPVSRAEESEFLWAGYSGERRALAGWFSRPTAATSPACRAAPTCS